nr:MAG TPA: hypothetical protein [Caudoviricetes sp.]
MDTVFTLCIMIFLLFKWLGSKANDAAREREMKDWEEWRSMVYDSDLEREIRRKLYKFETRESVLLSAIQTIRTFDDLKYADFSSDNVAVNYVVVAIEMAKAGKLPSPMTSVMLKDRDLHKALDITPTKESYLSMYKWFEKMVGNRTGKMMKIYVEGPLYYGAHWRTSPPNPNVKWRALDDLKTEEDMQMLPGAIRKYTEEDNEELIERKKRNKVGCFSDLGIYEVSRHTYVEPRW